MTTDRRPLSPHLQVYRLPLVAVLSIVHRITGLALVAGTPLLAYWLVALAAGPEAYARAQAMLGSKLGLLLLFGWTWALFYHLCNGIRHLFWDAGYGFALAKANQSGVAVVVASVVLTLATWLIAA
ncbi:MAG: succinate dehydrogenase, cytochrome b556 subunit [Gammaproteobacteria bacterium]